MKYRIETQQVFGLAGSGVAYDRGAEWLEHNDKPRGLNQAKAMMQARFDNNGFKPPIRVVAVNALGDKRVMAQIDSPHRFGRTQSFFVLADMHFRAVDECIQEGRPFSFREGTDHTGKPTPRTTHSYTTPTEEQPVAVLNDMEQEARAMLADSRDYHTLEGAFLLVRDGHAVWLCRQGEGAALDDCERLLCVASEVPEPRGQVVHAMGGEPDAVPLMGMIVFNRETLKWDKKPYDVEVMGVPVPIDGSVVANPLRSADGLRDVSPENYGFFEWETGGGCLAYRLNLADGGCLLLTDSSGAGLPDPDDDDSPMLGRYNAEHESVALVDNFAALPHNGTGETALAELERLHLTLRDIHESDADDDTDFDEWVRDKADFANPWAVRFLQLEKLIDVQ